eukprot:4340530-Pyramimonas_sp.AAC.1
MGFSSGRSCGCSQSCCWSCSSRGPPNGVVTTLCGKPVGVRGDCAVLGPGSFSVDVSGDWGLQGPEILR